MDRTLQKPLSPIRKKLRGVERLQCPAYRPQMIALDDPQQGDTGMVGGIRSRVDVEYARLLIGSNPTEDDEQAFTPYGWCDVPKVDLYVSIARYTGITVLCSNLVSVL